MTTLGLAVDVPRSRIELELTSALGTVEVQRSVDGGTSWQVVRGDSSADWTKIVMRDGGMATAFDNEAPMDVALLYRARGATTTATEAWTEVQTTSLPSPPGGGWTINPLAFPAFRIQTWTRAQPNYVQADPMGVFYALGRRDPIVTPGVRRAAVGSVTFFAGDAGDRMRWESMLADYALYIVRSPAAHGWGVRYCVFGDATFTRIVNRGVEAWDVVLPWWSIEVPEVPVQSYAITYADVRGAFNTYAQVLATFPNYDALRTAVL